VPVALLDGANSFLKLPSWRAWQQLFELAHFVVAERPGNGLQERLPVELSRQVEDRWIGSPAALHRAPAGRILRLQQPLRPESASEIRRRIRDQDAWQDQVPPPVAAYIVENGLYGAGAVMPASL